MNAYKLKPKTLEELIWQVEAWDGHVVRVEPHFDADNQLESVGIWIDPVHDQCGGIYEECWRREKGGWTLSDGAGDPNTNGGSALTGRDFG